MTGYEQLREGAAWLDLSNRSETLATGEDRARLLHAMTTNDIQRLTEGQGCYVFFLNAQGRILADANVFNLGESLLLDSEPELGQKIREHLDKFIIADDVTLGAEDGRWAIIGIEGPGSGEIMQKLGAPVPEEQWGSAVWGEGFVARVSVTGADGFRLFVPPPQMRQITGQLTAMGLVEADAEAIKTVRLENGKPRYGEDISERYLVQETNQMQAISFSKGCYLGQEIVERVRSRAQIHRVLTPVRIRSKEASAPGTKLTVEDKAIGEITSAAFSPAFGETVALAYIRVEQVQAKKEMAISGLEHPVTAYIPQ
jgi:folate-binding protein YgfZ